MKINYTSKWLLQKILAILFLVASSYTFYSIYGLELNNYEVISIWFKDYINSFSIFVLLTSILLHSNIGLTSIIDDYFHDQIIKQKILLIKNFFFVVLFFITISSLIGLIIK